MARNLRKFDTYNDYETAELVRPAVSLVVSPRKVYFDPINPTPPTPTFDGKWKATYSDSHTESAQCDASSTISSGEINKTNLVSVEIGDCVTTIKTAALQRCTNLTNITIGSGITNMAAYAISYNYNTTSLTINATTPPIIDPSSLYSTNNCQIYVPNGSVDAYKSAPIWSQYASRIQPIPNS